MGVILITGSTGFIGKEVLKQFAGGAEKLLLLVRSPERASELLNRIGVGQDERIILLKGDLSEPDLALSASDYERALEADVVIHAGGTMSLTLDEQTATRTFLDGARHVAQLAERIHQRRGLHHFIHVVGFMSPFHDENVDPAVNVFEQNEMTQGEGAYERMKFLADLYIRQQAQRLRYPLSVVNPSTVIGAKPAGVTEQTGGLGILIDAMRRKLMPVVPGGRSHWIPFIANDDLARAIVFLAREPEPISRTYNMLGHRESEPSMQELLTTISDQLRLPAPRLAVPVGFVRTFMKAGVSRLTGIPAESMSFITNRSFQTDSTEQLFTRMGQGSLNVRDIMPMVIADLDHRLTHPQHREPEHFFRARTGDLSALVRHGSGTPWVIVHGILGSSDDFVPLAELLHQRTGNPVWLLDLPGFGRSPSLQQGDAFAGYVDALCQAIASIPGPVRLVGHSFGAVVATQAVKLMPHHVKHLFLLQPVLHRPKSSRIRRWLSSSPKATRFLLQRISAGTFRNMLLRDGVFAEDLHIPQGYVDTVIRNLSSPRIAAANATMLQALHQRFPLPSTADLTSAKTSIIWGTKDKAYELPEPFHQFNDLQLVAYGHQFPLCHPQETARLLEQFATA